MTIVDAHLALEREVQAVLNHDAGASDARHGMQTREAALLMLSRCAQEIASITGGRYFRATSPEALAAIYEEIDQMETTEAETVEYVQYNEKGPLLALLAALALVGGLAVTETAGNRIP